MPLRFGLSLPFLQIGIEQVWEKWIRYLPNRDEGKLMDSLTG